MIVRMRLYGSVFFMCFYGFSCAMICGKKMILGSLKSYTDIRIGVVEAGYKHRFIIKHAGCGMAVYDICFSRDGFFMNGVMNRIPQKTHRCACSKCFLERVCHAFYNGKAKRVAIIERCFDRSKKPRAFRSVDGDRLKFHRMKVISPTRTEIKDTFLGSKVKEELGNELE